MAMDEVPQIRQDFEILLRTLEKKVFSHSADIFSPQVEASGFTQTGPIPLI
jgi:hypothetical protein